MNRNEFICRINKIEWEKTSHLQQHVLPSFYEISNDLSVKEVRLQPEKNEVHIHFYYKEHSCVCSCRNKGAGTAEYWLEVFFVSLPPSISDEFIASYQASLDGVQFLLRNDILVIGAYLQFPVSPTQLHNALQSLVAYKDQFLPHFMEGPCDVNQGAQNIVSSNVSRSIN